MADEMNNDSQTEFATKLRAVTAKNNLLVYIERQHGVGSSGKKIFLKILKAKLLRFGVSLEENICIRAFDDLNEVLADLKQKPEFTPGIRDKEVAERIRNIVALSVNKSERPLAQNYATMVELLFELSEGYLSRAPVKKMPAFVLLQCKGNTATALMAEIKKHPIVDEVALITGDADLYIRIFGTNKDIQSFLLKDLYKTAEMTASILDKSISPDSIIYSTKTYTSFDDSYFQKYPTSRHPDFIASATETI